MSKSKAKKGLERKRRDERLRDRKRRIEKRLDPARSPAPRDTPVIEGSNFHYEISEKSRAICSGGIGAMVKLVIWSGLRDAIDMNLQLLKVHLPYHESDHVLNIVFNVLAGGTSIEDIELRRNDENFLNALGAYVRRAGSPIDFCRGIDGSPSSSEHANECSTLFSSDIHSTKPVSGCTGSRGAESRKKVIDDPPQSTMTQTAETRSPGEGLHITEARSRLTSSRRNSLVLGLGRRARATAGLRGNARRSGEDQINAALHRRRRGLSLRSEGELL